MLNADMVNLRNACQKRAGICQNPFKIARFLALKNTVNYNLRFDINQDLARPVADGRFLSFRINGLVDAFRRNASLRRFC